MKNYFSILKNWRTLLSSHWCRHPDDSRYKGDFFVLFRHPLRKHTLQCQGHFLQISLILTPLLALTFHVQWYTYLWTNFCYMKRLIEKLSFEGHIVFANFEGHLVFAKHHKVWQNIYEKINSSITSISVANFQLLNILDF